MEKQVDLISIIIPACNSQDFIGGCLKSITGQSHRHLEIIVVDDGSSDGTADVCNSYANGDDRIRIIRQNNKGVSQARNVGLKYATGDYVAFIDSDDRIHKDYFKYLLTAIKSDDFDMAACRYVSTWDKDFSHDLAYNSCFPTKILSRDDWFAGLLAVPIDRFRNTFLPYETVWAKLYRKKVIDGISFENIWSEDAEYNSRVYSKLGKTIVVELPLYVYVQREESAHRSDPAAYSHSRIACACKIYENIDKALVRPKADALKRVWLGLLSTRYLLKRYGHSTKDEAATLKQIKEMGGLLYRPLIKTNYVSCCFKAAILIFYYMPFTYTLFRRALEKKAQMCR